MQKQGGSTKTTAIIRVNGKKLIEFDFKKDKEIEFDV
jgi:hypothetical protein